MSLKDKECRRHRRTPWPRLGTGRGTRGARRQGDAGIDQGGRRHTPSASPFYLYGPYKREGFATAPSNQAFDRSLRDRNPNWGLQDLEAVAEMARSVGFSAPAITEMPANNLSAVFRRK
jgi:hypothetical protein